MKYYGLIDEAVLIHTCMCDALMKSLCPSLIGSSTTLLSSPVLSKNIESLFDFYPSVKVILFGFKFIHFKIILIIYETTMSYFKYP